MIGQWLGNTIGDWFGRAETVTVVEQPAAGGSVKKAKFRPAAMWLGSDWPMPAYAPAPDHGNANVFILLAGKAT